MSPDAIWLIVSGAGAIQSLFLSIYIFLDQKIRREERHLLGSLLLVITLRIIKSIGWYYFDLEDDFLLNLGFAAHAFIGPVMVLYFLKKAHLNAHLAIKLLILSPSISLTLLSPLLSLSGFWYSGGYTWLLYMTNLYLAYAGYLLWIIYNQKKIYFPWYRNLFAGVLIFSLLYFTNYTLGLNPYLTGPIAYSIIIYVISFILLTNQEIFTPLGDKKKYKNINLSEDQIILHREKIENIMKEEKPYLNSDFSLTELSQLTFIPKHLLSRFFSENMNKSFTDYTNDYRINEAKKQLSDSKNLNLKIASIAYDSGFNSISAFNAAFKKRVGISPSEYRDSTTSN